MIRSGLLPAALALSVLAACGGDAPREVSDNAPVAYDDPDAEFPRIRYADGQLSLNDRCMVRGAKLNLRIPPVYVNGRPVGFC